MVKVIELDQVTNFFFGTIVTDSHEHRPSFGCSQPIKPDPLSSKPSSNRWPRSTHECSKHASHYVDGTTNTDNELYQGRKGQGQGEI